MGAYGGMGLSTIKLLKENWFIVFALDKEIKEKEEGIIPIKFDIIKEETIKEYTNELYAIINFAGVYILDSLVKIKSEEFYKIFQINVFSAFLINKTFISMLKKKSRIIITTNELAPLDPLPFTGLYGVSKKALDKYAYSLCI